MENKTSLVSMARLLGTAGVFPSLGTKRVKVEPIISTQSPRHIKNLSMIFDLHLEDANNLLGGILGVFFGYRKKEKNLAITSHALSHDKTVNIYHKKQQREVEKAEFGKQCLTSLQNETCPCKSQEFVMRI